MYKAPVPDGGMCQILFSPDGPEHIAGLQAGRGAGWPAGQGHVLNRYHNYQLIWLNIETVLTVFRIPVRRNKIGAWSED